MCKMYAHNLYCHFEKNLGECKQVHCEKVKAAHDYIVSCDKGKIPVKYKMIEQFLLPKHEDLSYQKDMVLKVRKHLLNRYPAYPNPKEVKRAQEMEEKE